MFRSFKFLEQRGDVVVTLSRSKAHRSRRNLERTGGLRLPRMSQAQTQKTIHNNFERLAAAPNFLIEKDRDVIVNGECCSHTMMLGWKAS